MNNQENWAVVSLLSKKLVDSFHPRSKENLPEDLKVNICYVRSDPSVENANTALPYSSTKPAPNPMSRNSRADQVKEKHLDELSVYFRDVSTFRYFPSMNFGGYLCDQKFGYVSEDFKVHLEISDNLIGSLYVKYIEGNECLDYSKIGKCTYLTSSVRNKVIDSFQGVRDLLKGGSKKYNTTYLDHIAGNGSVPYVRIPTNPSKVLKDLGVSDISSDITDWNPDIRYKGKTLTGIAKSRTSIMRMYSRSSSVGSMFSSSTALRPFDHVSALHSYLEGDMTSGFFFKYVTALQTYYTSWQPDTIISESKSISTAWSVAIGSCNPSIIDISDISFYDKELATIPDDILEYIPSYTKDHQGESDVKLISDRVANGMTAIIPQYIAHQLASSSLTDYGKFFYRHCPKSLYNEIISICNIISESESYKEKGYSDITLNLKTDPVMSRFLAAVIQAVLNRDEDLRGEETLSVVMPLTVMHIDGNILDGSTRNRSEKP